jgi:hypothetical protein
MRYELAPHSMRKAYAEFEKIRGSRCPSAEQIKELTNLIAWSAGIMTGAGVQDHIRRRAAELHVSLREYLAEATCAPRRRNPAARIPNVEIRWTRASDQRAPLDVRGHYEIYESPVTQAMLQLTDSWKGMSEAEIEDRVEGGDSAWTVRVRDKWNGRWYAFEDFFEESQRFPTREQALQAASVIAADMADARVRKGPNWRHDDIPAYLRWFQAQIPNRVDYVRLLWDNDANGSYDILLTSPVREAEESFHEAFDEIIAEDAP